MRVNLIKKLHTAADQKASLAVQALENGDHAHQVFRQVEALHQACLLIADNATSEFRDAGTPVDALRAEGLKLLQAALDGPEGTQSRKIFQERSDAIYRAALLIDINL